MPSPSRLSYFAYLGCPCSRLPVLGALLLSIPAVIPACGGRGPLDLGVSAYDSPGAQPNARDASTLDGASASDGGEDRGGGKDGGSPIPGFPDIPGLSGLLGGDAGALGACFSCAQTRCGTQVTACFDSPACIEEGLCDVTTCLAGGTTGSRGRGGAPGAAGGLACFQSCGSDSTASQELISAFTCVLGSCATSCLGAVASLGGATGGAGGAGGAGGTGTGAGASIGNLR